MISNEEKSISIKEPLSLKNATFLNFKINREEWNYYRLSDGSLLKGRLILRGSLIEGKLEDIITQVKLGEHPRLNIINSWETLYCVEAPPELRGPPDPKRYSPEETKQAITQRDIDCETVRELWNLYQLENGIILKMKLSPAVVSKTSKFEQFGMPLYLVESNLEMKMELPEYIQKEIDTVRQNVVKQKKRNEDLASGSVQ